MINEMADDDKPREKLIQKGASALSDAEILALFLGTGRQGVSVVELAREIIGNFGSLRNLSRSTVEELCQINGIGKAKAAQLCAVFEFGRRLAREPFSEKAIQSPEDVFELLGADMQRLSQESVRAVLNRKGRLIHIAEVFVGSGNESLANPSEILRKAISHAASTMILVHNHPSGDPSPSNADHQVTKRMKSACEAVGIEFADHIIIGCYSSNYDDPYFSFREAGLL